MKSTIILLLLLCSTSTHSFSQNKSIKKTDIKKLIGEWKGSLTYLDYTSKKPFTMPADLSVKYSDALNQLIFSNSYPNEPKANNIDTLFISIDGKMINNKNIVKRWVKNKNIEIVTEYKSVDGNDNKPAIIRHTYLFGKSTFLIIKEVQFDGEKDWIKRNEYKYSRSLF